MALRRGEKTWYENDIFFPFLSFVSIFFFLSLFKFPLWSFRLHCLIIICLTSSFKIPSFANLFLAIQADGFIGTSSSNWCRMINDLQKTRGDGGKEYLFLDQNDGDYPT
jgi:hypothetical protein